MPPTTASSARARPMEEAALIPILGHIRAMLKRGDRRGSRASESWSVTPEGLIRIDSLGSIEEIPWETIEEIVAFRALRMRNTEVYMELRHAGEFTLLGARHPDFDTVREAIEQRYAIDPMWFDRLALPPHDEEHLSLWRPSRIEAVSRLP